MSARTDLRSDTLTRPSPAMRRAMAEAEVGDDVFGEDPTVNSLEQRVAEITGKEAALFVASGTMANQLAIRSQTSLADEILVERDAHIFKHESGGAAAVSGVQIRQLVCRQGVITTAMVLEHLHAPDDHCAPVTLVALENTHNRSGGSIFPLDEQKRLRTLTAERGISLHVDGARIFNAAVATGIAVREYAALCDTMALCFSKGLGAPVGSALVASQEDIKRARRFRKMVGGGMRQAGVLAAAARYALDHNVERLMIDHQRARQLAAGIGALEPFRIVNDPPDTNMIIVELTGTGADAEIGLRTAPELCAALAGKGVDAFPVSPRAIRGVVHLDLDEEDIERALDAFRALAIRAD